MAIKYYCMPETGRVVGVLSGCKYDIINKIDKICRDTDFYFYCDERYEMPNTFKAEAIVRDGDVYDEEEGKRVVKEKIMKRYYASHDKRLDLFKCYLNNFVHKVERK